MKIFLTLILILTSVCRAEDIRDPSAVATPWNSIKMDYQKKKAAANLTGWSYIGSGGSAIIAGFIGARSSTDPIDRGIYSAFQIIGVTAIGIGLYKLNVNDQDMDFYKTLEDADLKPEQKLHLYESYQLKKKESEKQERLVRAITHGAAALLTLYGGSQQSNNTLQNGLYFLAGANLLAALSFTFNF